MLAILKENQQAVTIGIIALGIRSAKFNDAAVAAGVDLYRPAVVRPGRLCNEHATASKPHAPTKIVFVGIHEKSRVESSKLTEEPGLNEHRTAAGNEGFRPGAQVCGS